MNFALILASGTGSRVKSSKIPKQFIEINNKPIVAHTVDKFLLNKNIDEVVIVCHPEWNEYLTNYLKNFNKKAYVVNGGKTRNESILNGLNYIKNDLKAKGTDIVLTHDAVRMFITDRIINDNIDKAKEYGAVDTVVPSTDTIVESTNKETLTSIPNRDHLYNGQTPQSFKFGIIYDAYKNNKADTSDACRLVLENTKNKVALVIGDYENFKITTDFDLEFAKSVVKKND